MKLVCGSNDDGFDLGISQHRVIIEIGDMRFVESGHFAHQVFSHIADGVQLGIACLAAGLKMGSLRDRACPKLKITCKIRYLSHPLRAAINNPEDQFSFVMRKSCLASSVASIR